MQLNRFVWAVGLIIASGSGAWASARPKPLQTAQVEARNETAAPSFTGAKCGKLTASPAF